MRSNLNWGVVGTGSIAEAFVQALRNSTRCRVVNVAGSSEAKARAFAERWELPAASATLAELLADRAVEAVYIASPNPMHAEQTLACIAADKPVLCEKPFSIDFASAERVFAAARERQVFVAEGFMYRCHPLTAALLELLRAGSIGKLVHLRASFAFRVPRAARGRLFDPALGGGGILDTGGYAVSMARLLAGWCEDKPFAEPTSLQAVGRIGPHGADEHATALLRFASGFTAEVACAVRHDFGTEAVIYGEEGRIQLPDPWIPRGNRQGLETELTVYRDDQPPHTVPIRTQLATYAIEAERVADTLPALELSWPGMSWQDSLGNMKVLEAWRRTVHENDASDDRR